MWLYIPCQSATASVDSSEGSKSLSPDYSDQFCTVKGNSQSRTQLQRRLNQGEFRRLRSGLTSKHCALNQSAISYAREQAASDSASSAEGTPASRSPSPAASVALKILDTYGPALIERLANTGRTSSSSRMSQTTFGWGSEKSDEISKTEAIAFRRVYSRRLRLVLLTSDSGCSFSAWQTARAADSKSSTYQYDNADKDKPRLTLSGEAICFWATPDASVMNDGQSIKAYQERKAKELEKGYNGNGGGTPIAMQAQLWATPEAHDRSSRPGRYHDHDNSTGGGQSSLGDDVASWATPAASDSKRGASGYSETEISRPQGCPKTLNKDVHTWATPTTRDYKGGGETDRKDGKSRFADMLDWQAESHTTLQVPAIEPSGSESCKTSLSSPRPPEKQRLNPLFVAWLMGLVELTPYVHSETQWSLTRRRQRLSAWLHRCCSK